jgi:hypothetical protein
MTELLKELNGFRALQADLFIPWNTPFGKVREILQERKARDIEERGMRNIRFEETVGSAVDVQYELNFSPDYGYGLRSATAEIEQINGQAQLKDAQGSFRPFVNAYFHLLELLRSAYGEPSVLTHLDSKDSEKLVFTLDHTRENATAIAAWNGPTTRISHELLVSFLPRHLLRFSTVNSRLLVINKTGKSGLLVSVDFPGGSAQANMGKNQERVVELPLSGEVAVHATLGDRKAEIKFPIDSERRSIEIHSAWIFGTVRFKERRD